jgi:hypothetical protein
MAYANSPFWDAVTLLEKTLEDLEKLQAGWKTYPQGLAPKERLAKINTMIISIRTGLEKLRPSCTKTTHKNI